MKILAKEVIADIPGSRITKYVIHSPVIAANAQPGQFIILIVNEEGEKIPLTIVDSDKKEGSITLIVQEAGYSTKLLAKLSAGDSLYSLTGPLGHPTLIKNYGKILLIAGGVGIAELFPIARVLKQAGNMVYSILGSRTEELLILKNEIERYCDKLFIATDDGSLGQKGFVSNILEEILREETDFALCYCVGPVPMMKAIADITKPFKIKTLVCLNAIMLDGTGMCGCCRLLENGRIRLCCVDGPDFDGHLVDFDDLAGRLKRFIPEEKRALEKFEKHQCKLNSVKPEKA
jgi:ferredoxin--NADP+ reductase